MRLGRAPVTLQLNRLGLEARTGALRIPGDNGGTIYLYQGLVTGAESRSTPDVISRFIRWSPPLDAEPPGTLMQDWIIREAIADAALAMLPQAPRSARFSAGDIPAPDLVAMTVPELLTEVDRRQEVLRQLADVLTPDTVVARNPHLAAHSVRVSAGQWALLMRMSDRVTPRALALAAGTSVFTTTIGVFRLIALGMAATVDGPALGQQDISFTQAAIG